MPTLQKEIQTQRAYWQQHVFAPVGSLQPPAPPCPENGMLPSPFSNCGLPEFPATTLPYPGTCPITAVTSRPTPKEYLVYWGWGEPGSVPGCRDLPVGEQSPRARSPRRWHATPTAPASTWPTGSTSSAARSGPASRPSTTRPIRPGHKQYITNPTDQLPGIWVDDTNDATRGLSKTSPSNPPGSTNTYTDLAAEAARAVAHFGITDLANTDIVIAQPPNFSDPNALSSGYCAFHDYTYPGVEGGIYNGIQPGIAYTNMPYALAINSSGANECGENAVNSGAAGKLDGFSIVLGHEIHETITDPGPRTSSAAAGTTSRPRRLV